MINHMVTGIRDDEMQHLRANTSITGFISLYQDLGKRPDGLYS